MGVTRGWCSNDVRGVYGVDLINLLGKDGRFLLIILVLWLEWGLGSYLGMMFGVVILLSTVFLALFRIASNQDALVLDLLDSSDGSHQWNARFIRAAQDWAIEVEVP